jgi:hypothetical protein
MTERLRPGDVMIGYGNYTILIVATKPSAVRGFDGQNQREHVCIELHHAAQRVDVEIDYLESTLLCHFKRLT